MVGGAFGGFNFNTWRSIRRFLIFGGSFGGSYDGGYFGGSIFILARVATVVELNSWWWLTLLHGLSEGRT